jgi:hypothetical protein
VTQRARANALLRDTLTAHNRPPLRGPTEIAVIGGFRVVAEPRWIEAQNRRLLFITMPDLPRAEFALSHTDIDRADLVGRLENRLRGLDALADQLRRDLTAREQERARAVAGTDQPFRHADALGTARARLAAIDAQITQASRPLPPAPDEDSPARRTGEPASALASLAGSEPRPGTGPFRPAPADPRPVTIATSTPTSRPRAP